MLNPAFKNDTTFRRKSDKAKGTPTNANPQGTAPKAFSVTPSGIREIPANPKPPTPENKAQPTPTPENKPPLPAAPATATVSPAAAKPLPSAPKPSPFGAAASGIVSTELLSKTYGKREVVHEVNISVRAGEIVGLLGPNGAGKTTSFYMIVGLIPATSGKVFLDGRDITSLPMWRRARLGLGYLPQEASIFRKLTVWENVMAIVETMPLPAARRKEHTAAMLEELGLTRLAKQPAYTLSGGERRRLEIARALATRPRFMLLDEPFSGVDPISVADVQNIVRQLKNRGIGVLITDHNVRETLSIVDRAYLIHQGRVFVEGTSEFIINDPMSRKFYLGETFKM